MQIFQRSRRSFAKCINLSCSTRRSFSGESETLVKTSLFDWHLDKGGKIVPFAGYELPVQYEGMGVLKEHLHTRAALSASLFDVSHMGQIHWHGKDAVKFIEKMVVGDVASLKYGEAKLSLIMKEDGGIMDDTVITNAGNFIYMVVNGACKYKDMDHFQKYLNLNENKALDVKMEYHGEQQLLALQGPGSAAIMTQLAPTLEYKTMPFMNSQVANVAGIPNCRVTRCGYTGEDGFEISVHPNHTIQLADALLSLPSVAVVKPAGLGARDSLRLEAGLCLYGNDIDETTNPIEAGLLWTIGGPKSRRRLQQGFLGASAFLEPDGKPKKVSKKRVGIAEMKAPARSHTEVFSSASGNSKEGCEKIGEITSGGFGPSLGKPVAMGYVKSEYAAEGTEVMLSVRGKLQPAKVTKMPFLPTSYFRAPA